MTPAESKKDLKRRLQALIDAGATKPNGVHAPFVHSQTMELLDIVMALLDLHPLIRNLKTTDNRKQNEVTAQTFKRLATQIRKIGKECCTFYEVPRFATKLAKAFDAEVKLLRAKR